MVADSFYALYFILISVTHLQNVIIQIHMCINVYAVIGKPVAAFHGVSENVENCKKGRPSCLAL